MIAVDQRPPPTGLPRQLVGPTSAPQQFHVECRRHPPAVEKQPEIIPKQRLGDLPERYGDPQRRVHRRHHTSQRLGPWTRT